MERARLFATGLGKLHAGRPGELTVDECEALVHFGAASLLPPGVFSTREGHKSLARRDQDDAGPMVHSKPIAIRRVSAHSPPIPIQRVSR